MNQIKCKDEILILSFWLVVVSIVTILGSIDVKNHRQEDREVKITVESVQQIETGHWISPSMEWLYKASFDGGSCSGDSNSKVDYGMKATATLYRGRCLQEKWETK